MTRAVTSASNIHRRSLCPGSERFETGLPDEDSEESREGTLLHKHIANPVLDRKKLKPSQRDLLDVAAKLHKEVFQTIGNQFGVTDVVAVGGSEREMFLHRGFKSLFLGHCDIWEYYEEHKLLVIIDDKYGFKVVTPAAANLQLRSYAVMGAELYDCDNVAVAIVQPRLPYEERLTMAVYSRDDIEAARLQLYEIWDNAKNPDAPLVAGEEQCRYCKARTFCPALAAKVNEGMSLISFPEGKTVAARTAAITERIAQASDVELSRMYEAVHLAGYVKDPLFDEMRERIQVGGMHGYKLGKESEIREVTDVAAAVAQIESQTGLGRTETLAACKMSLGKIEDMIREKDGGTWKDAKDQVNTILGGLIERKTKKPAVERVK